MTTKSYISIIAVVIVLMGLYAFISRQQPAAPTEPPPGAKPPQYNSRLNVGAINSNWNTLLSFADAPALGSPKAEYTLIEVGDFQCPQCGKVRPLVEELIARSHGDAKLYFVNFPLTNAHPHALYAAQAALAAADQGKFWPMYEVLYEHQDELIPSEIQYYAGTEINGFDVKKYLADVNAQATAQRVQDQLHEVQSLNIDSTPTLLIRKTAGGTPTWYIGANDDAIANTKGVTDLAAAPPWLVGR